MIISRLLIATLFISHLIFSNSVLAAAKLSISPVQIHLSPSAKTSILTVGNKGKEPVNLQLDAKTWDMDENGKFVEGDTGDFIFYPKTLTIAPQQSATIRTGYMGDFPQAEKTFRIIIDEIPNVTRTLSEANKVNLGIQNVLRLSIPLYVTPDNTTAISQIELGGLKTDAKHLRVGVKNLTDYHADLKSISVKLLAQNKLLAEKTVALRLQRVLGKHLVFINVPMQTSLCNQADTLKLRIETANQKQAYEKQLSLTSGCQL